MPRIALGVEYDGTHFHGWQSQKSGVRTVQSELEQALSIVADNPIRVICAGRTDAGVHGTAQVVHFDSPVTRPPKAWVYGSNVNSAHDVTVRWATDVSDDFHARFSAISRRYRYVIYNNPIKPALLNSQLTWNYRPLDENKMQRAANLLVGTHDFTSYRTVHCQAKSPVRTIEHLKVTRQGDLIVLDVQANAFLHHMVRNIAGVLMAIGAGLQPEQWAKEVLEHQDRAKGGVTAPPFGLYLVGVDYPSEFDLPKYELGPFFLSALNQ